MSAPIDTRIWCVHAIGPDELHPAPDFETAMDWAIAANRRHADAAEILRFVVAPWPYGTESHAEALPRTIADWSPPAAASAPEFLFTTTVGGLVWRDVDDDRAVALHLGEDETGAIRWAMRLMNKGHELSFGLSDNAMTAIVAIYADLSTKAERGVVVEADVDVAEGYETRTGDAS